jgi:hypothetical protein
MLAKSDALRSPSLRPSPGGRAASSSRSSRRTRLLTRVSFLNVYSAMPFAVVRQLAPSLFLRDHHLAVHRLGNSSASRPVVIEWPSASVSGPYEIHWLPCQRSVTPRPSTARRNVPISSEGVFFIVAQERSVVSLSSWIKPLLEAHLEALEHLFEKGKKYGKDELQNAVQPPSPFWSASEAGRRQRIFVQRHSKQMERSEGNLKIPRVAHSPPGCENIR